MDKHPLYFIALMPPAKIRKEVEIIKEEVRIHYGIKHALKLPAHITLQIPFRMPEDRVLLLEKKLKTFCEKQTPWVTELEGFGKFAKNVIFIKIKDHEPFIKIHQDLQEFMLNFIALESHEISSQMHPHITVATRDLKRSHFPEIWEHFKNKRYSASFECRDLDLLKHNGKTWDLMRRFHF